MASFGKTAPTCEILPFKLADDGLKIGIADVKIGHGVMWRAMGIWHQIGNIFLNTFLSGAILSYSILIPPSSGAGTVHSGKPVKSPTRRLKIESRPAR